MMGTAGWTSALFVVILVSCLGGSEADDIIITGNTGSFLSPNYPDKYPKNLHQLYIARLHTPGPQQVQLDYVMNLEEKRRGRGCYDYILLPALDDESHCGDINGTFYISIEGSEFNLTLITDYSRSRTGFNITYRVVEDPTADDATTAPSIVTTAGDAATTSSDAGTTGDVSTAEVDTTTEDITTTAGNAVTTGNDVGTTADVTTAAVDTTTDTTITTAGNAVTTDTLGTTVDVTTSVAVADTTTETVMTTDETTHTVGTTTTSVTVADTTETIMTTDDTTHTMGTTGDVTTSVAVDDTTETVMTTDDTTHTVGTTGDVTTSVTVVDTTTETFMTTDDTTHTMGATGIVTTSVTVADTTTETFMTTDDTTHTVGTTTTSVTVVDTTETIMTTDDTTHTIATTGEVTTSSTEHGVVSPNTLIPTSAPSSHTPQQCPCKCVWQPPPVRDNTHPAVAAAQQKEEEEKQAQVVKAIQKELTVPAANVSAQTRRSVSAGDQRPSSMYVGMTVGVVCFLPLAAIILSDSAALVVGVVTTITPYLRTVTPARRVS